MQEYSPTPGASQLSGGRLDHHLSNYRGRWFLSHRLLGGRPGQRAFARVHLDTYDLATARTRRNAFIEHLQCTTAHRLEAAA